MENPVMFFARSVTGWARLLEGCAKAIRRYVIGLSDPPPRTSWAVGSYRRVRVRRQGQNTNRSHRITTADALYGEPSADDFRFKMHGCCGYPARTMHGYARRSHFFLFIFFFCMDKFGAMSASLRGVGRGWGWNPQVATYRR